MGWGVGGGLGLVGVLGRTVCMERPFRNPLNPLSLISLAPPPPSLPPSQCGMHHLCNPNFCAAYLHVFHV